MKNKLKRFLVGDTFMPEMYLKQPGFTYSASRPFTKSKERKQKCKQAEGSRCIYQKQNKQKKADKLCFQHHMVYRDFKDLPIRTVLDKVLRPKIFHTMLITQEWDLFWSYHWEPTTRKRIPQTNH